MPQTTLRPRFSLLALATGGLLLLSGGCVDSPTEAPAPVLTPPMSSPLTAAFQSPIDRDAFSAAAAPMGASTNSGLDLGGTGWVPLDASVPEPMHVYFRTSGATRYSINPNVVPGFCDILCVFKVPPYFPGVVGGAGIPGTGWLRYRVRVNGAELIGYPLPDGQMEFLAHVSPGDSIFVQRTGIDGVVTCLTLLICAGYREGWYSLTNQGLHIEALKVLPLQVQPETEVAAPGDSVTFRVATFDENVSRWSWLWRHANGASGPGFSECTGKRECRVPVTDGGYMVVHDGRWRITQPLRQAVSAPVRVQDAKLRLTCNNGTGRVTVVRGTSVRCVAAVEPTSATLEVVGWQFTRDGLTITPNPAQNTSRQWVGEMVVSGRVAVDAKVDGIGMRDTVFVEVGNRNWNIAPLVPTPPPPTPVGVPDLPYPPVLQAGINHGIMGMYVLPISYSLGTAGSGPNEGWRFFRSPPRLGTPTIHVNRALFEKDPIYEAQHGRGNVCARSFMDRWRNNVIQHENGHHAIAAKFWNGDAAIRFDTTTLYMPGLATPRDTVMERLIALAQAPEDSAQDAFDNKDVFRVTCRLNYNVRR